MITLSSLPEVPVDDLLKLPYHALLVMKHDGDGTLDSGNSTSHSSPAVAN